MKAILLAAGYATRLYPLTKDRPKGLLSVAGKTIMDHIADEIDTINEIDEVIVISNHKFFGQFKAWTDRRNSRNGKKYTILDDGSTDDSNKLGAIGDIQFCIDKLSIDDDLVIIAGDNFFTYKLKDAYDYFKANGLDMVLAKRFTNKTELKRMAVAITDDNNIIVDMIEKPEKPESDLGIFATYFYKKDTIPLIRKYLDEGNKPDAPGYFPVWLHKIKNIKVYVFDGECYDIGTPEAYKAVNRKYQQKNVLVTGGTGYIGSHTCVELLNEGYNVFIIDNLSNSKKGVLDRIGRITGKSPEFEQIDLLDEVAVDKVIRENKFDAVIHFAGLKAVGESVRLPLKYYHNNITGTIILCEKMKKYGLKRIVFSSSATVYGRPDKMPISEDFPINAINPYGRTKQMIESILCDIHSSDSAWGISLLRYFNPVGAHQSGLIGEDPNGIPNNLMPFVSQVAIGKLPSLRVYGNDYPTSDGTGVRDYIHVTDLAKGHIMALEKLFASDGGVQVYNLGTGKGYSVLEVINAFEKASGVKIPYEIAERREGDTAVCYADSAKAEKELGWRAVKGMDEMCTDAWRWQTGNPSGYRK